MRRQIRKPLYTVRERLPESILPLTPLGKRMRSMCSNKADFPQSQLPHKPVVFTGLEKQLLHHMACTEYDLDKFEARLLNAFLIKLSHVGKFVQLTAKNLYRYDSRTTWFQEIQCTNVHYVSRIFDSLEKKKILFTMSVGRQTRRYLHPDFLMWIADKFIEYQTQEEQEAVDNVDNSEAQIHSSESGEFIPVNTTNSPEQIAAIHPNESGSIIEELVPPELVPHEFVKQKSYSYAKTVDNLHLHRYIDRLSNFTTSIEDAAEFVIRLTERSEDGSYNQGLGVAPDEMDVFDRFSSYCLTLRELKSGRVNQSKLRTIFYTYKLTVAPDSKQNAKNGTRKL